MNRQKTAPIVVISGPSGSGKTTLCREMAKSLSFDFSVSYTTRPMRKGEENGVDYHFVPKEEFDRMMREGDFLEWATVYGNHYGTSKKMVEDGLAHERGIIFDVDPYGALAIKKKYPEALLVFIVPPSVEQLEDRLKKRGTESDDKRRERLSRAADEETFKKYYDLVLVNRDVELSLVKLEKIIREHFEE